MTGKGRTNDWGFPRWRGYESGREAKPSRLCDRYGCGALGDCPAPKAPNSTDRWYFCKDHAAEYNQGWDYFNGLSREDADNREQDESRTAQGYRSAAYHRWATGDGERSTDEMRALAVLGLDADVDLSAIRSAWRVLAKESHPDVKPNDVEAAKRFQAGQLAFDILRRAEERRQASHANIEENLD